MYVWVVSLRYRQQQPAGSRLAYGRLVTELSRRWSCLLSAGPSSTSSLLRKCRVSPPNSLPPRLRCSSRDEQDGKMKMKMRKSGIGSPWQPKKCVESKPVVGGPGWPCCPLPYMSVAKPLIDTETGSSRALRSEDSKRQSKQSSVKISPPPVTAATKHPQ